MTEKQRSGAERKAKRTPQAACETCVHFDWDDLYQEYVCTQDLDEDEMVRYMAGNFSACPYYRFYDEYKSVQKQN